MGEVYRVPIISLQLGFAGVLIRLVDKTFNKDENNGEGGEGKKQSP